MGKPTFTIGIEEEYLLVDRETCDVPAEPPATMLAECQTLLTGQVSPKFLRSQIEVETRAPASPSTRRALIWRICA
jgi:carboxylate-amine ligase